MTDEHWKSARAAEWGHACSPPPVPVCDSIGKETRDGNNMWMN